MHKTKKLVYSYMSTSKIRIFRFFLVPTGYLLFLEYFCDWDTLSPERFTRFLFFLKRQFVLVKTKNR